MKRIYFLLATMAVFLMTGCSDHNEVVIDPDPVGGEGLYFSIGVSDGLTTTKAENPPVLGNEDKIYNLTALLFYSSEEGVTHPEGITAGNYAYGKYVDTPNDGTLNFVGDLEVDPGTYDIILIANSTIDYTASSISKPTWTTLNNIVDDITTQNSNNMLMVSEPYIGVSLNYMLKEDGVLYERNTYCYMLNGKTVTSDFNAKQQNLNATVYKDTESKPVLLTRLASRIQLESLKVEFPDNNLAGCSFQLDSVYLVNLRKGTKLIPADDKYEAIAASNPLYYRGAPANFTIYEQFIAPNDLSVSIGGKALKTGEPANNGIIATIADGATLGTKGTAFYFDYAYENYNVWFKKSEDRVGDGYETRLVISGKILYPTETGTVSYEQSYYHVPIRSTDTKNALTRNNIYTINATISGYGYNEPDGPSRDNVDLKFDIKVEPWNIIKQYEND